MVVDLLCFSSINWTNINMHVSIHFIPIVIHALEEHVHRYSAQKYTYYTTHVFSMLFVFMSFEPSLIWLRLLARPTEPPALICHLDVSCQND
jgi:hypothetical protein